VTRLWKAIFRECYPNRYDNNWIRVFIRFFFKRKRDATTMQLVLRGFDIETTRPI